MKCFSIFLFLSVCKLLPLITFILSRTTFFPLCILYIVKYHVVESTLEIRDDALIKRCIHIGHCYCFRSHIYLYYRTDTLSDISHFARKLAILIVKSNLHNFGPNCLYFQVLAIMSHDVDNMSTQNAAIVLYRNIKDTIRTHFAETNGAGAFLEAPLQAYYGRQSSLLRSTVREVTTHSLCCEILLLVINVMLLPSTLTLSYTAGTEGVRFLMHFPPPKWPVLCRVER